MASAFGRAEPGLFLRDASELGGGRHAQFEIDGIEEAALRPAPIMLRAMPMAMWLLPVPGRRSLLDTVLAFDARRHNPMAVRLHAPSLWLRHHSTPPTVAPPGHFVSGAHSWRAPKQKSCVRLESQTVVQRLVSEAIEWSERGDLNSRPPAPQAGALTRLRYAPSPFLWPAQA
jgi:hypothetical protein